MTQTEPTQDELTPGSPPTGFGRWVDVTTEEHALLLLAHLAVATVAGGGHARRLTRALAPYADVLAGAGVPPADVEDYLAGVVSASGRWRDRVSDRAADLDEDRLAMLAIHLCTAPLFTQPGTLTSTVAIRRMDAVLDLFDVPFNAIGIQSQFVDTLSALESATHAPTGPLSVDKAARIARPYTEYLTWVHPLIGAAANIGLGRLEGDDEPSSSDVGDPALDELARAVMACTFAFEGTEQRTQAGRIRDLLLTELRAHEPKLPGLTVASAIAALTELAGTSAPKPADAPQLSGHTLSEARHVLATLGLDCQVEDDLRPSGSSRLILSDTNWRVVDQTATPTGISLKVRKHTDPTR